MDPNRPMTKREMKALRRLEKLDYAASGKQQNTIKWLIIGAASLLFLVFFGFLIFLAKQGNVQNTESVVISDAGWVKGNENAPLTMIEFSDFQCPACRSYYPIVKELLVSYEDGKVKFIYKHFPLTSIHPNAMPAAIAAEAAGAQGKFFEYHDVLFEKQGEWVNLPVADVREKFISYAKDLNLDKEKFKTDLENKEFEAKIKANQEEGVNAGVSGTPTFFVNGEKIQNPASLDAFKKIIDSNLK